MRRSSDATPLRLVHAGPRRALAHPPAETLADLIDQVLAKPVHAGVDPLFDPHDHQVVRLKELVLTLMDMAHEADEGDEGDGSRVAPAITPTPPAELRAALGHLRDRLRAVEADWR